MRSFHMGTLVCVFAALGLATLAIGNSNPDPVNLKSKWGVIWEPGTLADIAKKFKLTCDTTLGCPYTMERRAFSTQSNASASGHDSADGIASVIVKITVYPQNTYRAEMLAVIGGMVDGEIVAPVKVLMSDTKGSGTLDYIEVNPVSESMPSLCYARTGPPMCSGVLPQEYIDNLTNLYRSVLLQIRASNPKPEARLE